MKVLLGAIIASFLVGMWFGVNIGKGNALYDNPFSDPDIIHDAHDSADDAGLIDQGKDFMLDQKDKIKDKAKDMIDDL